MPGLFMFGYSAESKLNHQMQQMALETEQNRGVARWAEEQISSSSAAATTGNNKLTGDNGMSTEERLTELYKQSVENSGVRIVPSLGMHHRVANYWQENPFKVLALLGGKTNKREKRWMYLLVLTFSLSLSCVCVCVCVLVVCVCMYSSDGGVYFLRSVGPGSFADPNEGDAHPCHGSV